MSDFDTIINKMITETGISKNKAMVYYEMFFDSYFQKQDMIDSLIKKQESKELLKNFHQLKGAAVNLRFDDLGFIISEMEGYIREGNFVKCCEAIQTFLYELNNLKKQMDETKRLQL